MNRPSLARPASLATGRRRDAPGRALAESLGAGGEQLLALLPQAMALVDPAGTIVHANASLAALLSRPPDDLVGSSLEELAVAPSEHVAELLRRWRGSATWRPGGLSLRTGADETLDLHCEGARLRGTDLVLLHLVERAEGVGGFASLTRERELRNLREMELRLQGSLRELEEANQRLEAVNDELESYASMVAHDIRTPFNAIGRFSELLLEDHELPEAAREMVGAVGRLADRGERVTEALLTLARIGAPQDGQVADGSEVVRAVLEQLHREIDDAGAEVVVGDLLPVAVDPLHLGQLFTNLIGNSLKFATDERAPRIEVRGHRAAHRVQFEVSDNGVGIAEEERDRIFDPLVRGTASADRPGTGVGLATCRRIVQSYGGTISCPSTEGPGATFVFDLPVADPASADHGAATG